MLTPFVKPRTGTHLTQLFSIGHCTIFFSVTRSKRLRNYSVSESGGAPQKGYFYNNCHNIYVVTMCVIGVGTALF